MLASKSFLSRWQRSRRFHVLHSVISALFLNSLVAAAAPIPTDQPPGYPTWWFSQGLIQPLDPNNLLPSWENGDYPVPDDYAVANVGQLKQIATKAAAQMNAGLPGGAGNAVNNLIAQWNAPPASNTVRDDYAALNLGQLKAVAQLFYDQLISVGYTTTYPWAASGLPEDDFAAANVGQLKYVFSFNLEYGSTTGDGVPDWWAIAAGLDPNDPLAIQGQAANPTYLNPDGSAETYAQAYLNGANPANVSNPTPPAISNSLWVEVPDVNIHPIDPDYSRIVLHWNVANLANVSSIQVQCQAGSSAPWQTIGEGDSGQYAANGLFSCLNYRYRLLLVMGDETVGVTNTCYYMVPLLRTIMIQTAWAEVDYPGYLQLQYDPSTGDPPLKYLSCTYNSTISTNETGTGAQSTTTQTSTLIFTPLASKLSVAATTISGNEWTGPLSNESGGYDSLSTTTILEGTASAPDASRIYHTESTGYLDTPGQNSTSTDTSDEDIEFTIGFYPGNWFAGNTSWGPAESYAPDSWGGFGDLSDYTVDSTAITGTDEVEHDSVTSTDLTTEDLSWTMKISPSSGAAYSTTGTNWFLDLQSLVVGLEPINNIAGSLRMGGTASSPTTSALHAVTGDPQNNTQPYNQEDDTWSLDQGFTTGAMVNMTIGFIPPFPTTFGGTTAAGGNLWGKWGGAGATLYSSAPTPYNGPPVGLASFTLNATETFAYCSRSQFQVNVFPPGPHPDVSTQIPLDEHFTPNDPTKPSQDTPIVYMASAGETHSPLYAVEVPGTPGGTILLVGSQTQPTAQIVPADVPGVLGDQITSIYGANGEKHYVSPKMTADTIKNPFVTFKAQGIAADQFQQQFRWAGDGQPVGTDPLQYQVSRNTTGHFQVQILNKTTGAVVDKMNVWIIWATLKQPVQEGIGHYEWVDSPQGFKYLCTNSAAACWRFVFSIEPKELFDQTSDVPDLTGDSDKPVPGAGKPYPIDPTVPCDSAPSKWDMSRQVRTIIRNPNGISSIDLRAAVPPALLDGQPSALTVAQAFPSGQAEGNDDPPGVHDQEENPYQAYPALQSGVTVVFNDGLNHGVGEVSSVDAPTSSVIQSWGATGYNYAYDDDFREFVRVQLWNGSRAQQDGTAFWFRISNFVSWHHYLRVHWSTDASGSRWFDGYPNLGPSSSDLGNQTAP